MQISENARTVLERRYLAKDNGKIETPEEMLRRVAANVASAEQNWDKSKVKEMAEKFSKSWISLSFYLTVLP